MSLPPIWSFRLRPVPVVAALVSAAACADTLPRSSPYRGEPLPAARPRPDFTLTDTRGAPYPFLAQTKGTLTLLMFGYTNCPDVCPVHMANIAAALHRLPYDVWSRTRVVFVTTDPERDTPEKLRAWLDGFDPSFVGLRGTPEEIHAAERLVGVAASVPEHTAPNGSYAVGHAAQVIAYTPDDSAHLVYPFGTRQTDWAHDLPLLVVVR
ncbi:MAG TPA: SCO family protein [Gemmatimonadaceae bacterium]|nr:SCO family protein [Gemmatimonadaceae bacterium]